MNLRFGLRLKIITTLVVVFSLLSFASFFLLQQQANQAALVQERENARNDLRRVLLALDSQLSQFDVLLRSWASSSEFYDHASRSSQAFVDNELSATTLAQVDIDWLLRVTPDGEIVDLVDRTSAGEVQPVQQWLSKHPDEVGAWTQQLATAPGLSGCGLVRIGKRRDMMCFRPLLPSSGKGDARGVVVMGRNFSADILIDVANQLGVGLELLIDGSNELGAALGAPVQSRLGQGLAQARFDASSMQVNFPLTGYFGAPLGRLQMTIPRSNLQQVQASGSQTMKLMLLLVALTGAIMILVVDKLVVNRIRRLGERLGDIVDAQTWEGTLLARGGDEISELTRYINKVVGIVRAQMLALQNASLTDPLTKLANRRCFDERFDGALQRHARNGQPLALLLFDADFFKKYNDCYGHPAGDAVLQIIANVLSTAARRPGDLAARLGGEEFALLLEDTDQQGAKVCAELVLQGLREKSVVHTESSFSGVMTLSCGLAMLRSGDTVQTLYQHADKALYQAKVEGRNRVSVATPNEKSLCNSNGGLA